MMSEIRDDSRIPALDGLRAVAILAVMAHHCADRFQSLHLYKAARLGWVGVDLFFVLSGFLITGILLNTRTRVGYFRAFYGRRALRIWPLYYLVLLIVFLVLPAALRHHPALAADLGPFSGRLGLIYGTYTQNFFDLGEAINPLLLVTWSLAIEEQFYLIWPLLIYFLAPKRMLKVALLILLASPLARLIAVHFGATSNVLYKVGFFHLDSLCSGAIVAIILNQNLLSRGALRKWGVACAALGIVGFALYGSRAGSTSIVHTPWEFSWLALAFGGILCLTLTAPEVFTRLLSTRFLTFTGTVSYCLYLAHPAVFLFVNSNTGQRLLRLPMGSRTDMLAVLLAFGLSYAIAIISWYSFESRLLRLKRYFVAGAGISQRTVAPVRP